MRKMLIKIPRYHNNGFLYEWEHFGEATGCEITYH